MILVGAYIVIVTLIGLCQTRNVFWLYNVYHEKTQRVVVVPLHAAAHCVVSRVWYAYMLHINGANWVSFELNVAFSSAAYTLLD